MMPATTPNPAKAQAKREYTAPTFVDISLSEPQKADLRSFRDTLTADALATWVDGRVTNGHVLSVKPQEVGFLASLTGQGTASGHDGLCMVARASTPRNALTALMFRDVVICASQPWPATRKAEFDI